ncbi:MAG: PH domain-containing protein [Planctomycetota bacterium]
MSSAKQAIAGVSPAGSQETHVMVIWPSICVTWIGRLLGRLYAIDFGFYIFRVGNVIALCSAPIAALLYLAKVAPFTALRYRLTNQRLIVERGILGAEERSITLDRFDSVSIEQRPGQAWFDAGDLVFSKGSVETFRLEAVARPEAFSQICMKSQMAYTGVNAAIGQPAVA